MNTPKLFILSIFLLIVSNSYSQNKYNTQNAKGKVNSILQIEETEENDAKVLELGNNIQSAIFNSSTNSYMSHFDYDAFGDLITKDLEEDYDSRSYKIGFLKGLKDGIKSVPKKIFDEVNAGGYYDYVNYSYNDINQTYHMLFRLYSPITGLNYHNYRVSKLNGKFVFNDIYVYLSGEELSKTFRRLYMFSLPKKSFFNLFGESNTDEFTKMIEAVQFYKKEQFTKAHNKFKEIDGDLKYDKFILILKTICASQVSDEEYKKAMKTIAEKYPDDTSLYLSQIDYHIMNKNYDTALLMINKLEEDTTDGFLNLLKGNIEYERSNLVKALEHFKYMSDNFPDFFEGHSSYLTALSLNGDFKKGILFLSFLIDEGYEKNDLIGFVEELDENGENNLEDLAKSNQFKNWKKK